jgi:hypothetical protein
MPKKFHGPPAVAKGTAKPKRKPNTRKAAGKRRHAPKEARPQTMPTVQTTRPSRVWWIVPIGILSLVVIVPVMFGIVTWYRNWKAVRESARWHQRSQSKDLPS